jgi:hypothetical protein
MKHFRYDAIPSVAQFRSDSSVTFAVRGDDKILAHLDWLLERFHFYCRKADNELPRIILCEIFLTANYWIKSYHQHVKANHEKRLGMRKERYPAVLALFEAVVERLCGVFGCTRPMVPMMIEEIFGRDLTEGGRKADDQGKTALFTDYELQLYRVRFKGGRAYHLGPNAKVV